MRKQNKTKKTKSVTRLAMIISGGKRCRPLSRVCVYSSPLVPSAGGSSRGNRVCVCVCLCTSQHARAYTYVYIDNVNKRAKWSGARDKRNTKAARAAIDYIRCVFVVFDRARAARNRGEEREKKDAARDDDAAIKAAASRARVVGSRRRARGSKGR